MRRKLYLVLNYGGIGNRLPNVRADKENYLRFFRSPEGGAWEETEMEIHENDFDFDVFAHHIRFQQKIQRPYDYLVIVFCGHGYSDWNGERWIEVRPGDSDDVCVSLSQIREACYNTRTLFISDACLAVPQEEVRERLYSSINKFTGNIDYREECKRLYNEIVMKTSEYTFTAGYAVSLGEKAGDDERGGIYSQTLLDVARDTIGDLKHDSGLPRYASFSAIHEMAADIVADKTNGDQHPSIEMSRSYYQLPFVVAPYVQING